MWESSYAYTFIYSSLFSATGNVDKTQRPPNSGTTVLAEINKIVILETVLDKLTSGVFA